ncbi:MAG: HEPN domain-containing protein [Syntrophobacteraceae bacterium]
MLTRAALKELAKSRLKEAKVLCDCGLYDGAHYLAGYVVELALKARICRVLDVDFPDKGEISQSFKTHNLKTLLGLAGLSTKFENAKVNNPGLLASWSTIEKWSETFRYDPVGTSEEEKTKDFIDAIENPNDGIFTWIKKYW